MCVHIIAQSLSYEKIHENMCNVANFFCNLSCNIGFGGETLVSRHSTGILSFFFCLMKSFSLETKFVD